MANKKFDVPVTPEIEAKWQNWHAFNQDNCSIEALRAAVEQDGWHSVSYADWLENSQGESTEIFRIWSGRHLDRSQTKFEIYTNRHADFRGELAEVLYRATRDHNTYSSAIEDATLFVSPNPWRLIVIDEETMAISRVIRLDGVTG